MFLQCFGCFAELFQTSLAGHFRDRLELDIAKIPSRHFIEGIVCHPAHAAGLVINNMHNSGGVMLDGRVIQKRMAPFFLILGDISILLYH